MFVCFFILLMIVNINNKLCRQLHSSKVKFSKMAQYLWADTAKYKVKKWSGVKLKCQML
ncbi:hypothetical protein INR49_015934 [Caranx melampygus]|nr:hypothetical protein INR49_015934 [Caranx melampygus]